MYILLTIAIILISIVLMVIILIQNPKGGGLGAGFGGGSSNVMGGVKQTTDFLEKATWTLISVIFFLCIISTAFVDRSQSGGGDADPDKTKIENILDED